MELGWRSCPPGLGYAERAGSQRGNLKPGAKWPGFYPQALPTRVAPMAPKNHGAKALRVGGLTLARGIGTQDIKLLNKLNSRADSVGVGIFSSIAGLVPSRLVILRKSNLLRLKSKLRAILSVQLSLYIIMMLGVISRLPARRVLSRTRTRREGQGLGPGHAAVRARTVLPPSPIRFSSGV